MTNDEYLQKVLESQTFENDDPELKTLRERIETVKKVLKGAFEESNPSLRQAGSLAKGTMIIESYDGDLTCYFPHEDTEPGDSLKKIYESVGGALQTDYQVQWKPSAIRLSGKSGEYFGKDFHIDVVPGRFVDDSKTDVNLYRSSGEKSYLKTNLQVHIDHVKKSGVRTAIRLAKLWNTRNGVQAKTFVLELLVIKLLEDKVGENLSKQLTHVFTEFCDNAENLTVEDPANPSGNDLKPLIDECRRSLSSVAQRTLSLIASSGWTAVFGDVEDEKASQVEAVKSAVSTVRTGTKPWSN